MGDNIEKYYKHLGVSALIGFGTYNWRKANEQNQMLQEQIRIKDEQIRTKYEQIQTKDEQIQKEKGGHEQTKKQLEQIKKQLKTMEEQLLKSVQKEIEKIQKQIPPEKKKDGYGDDAVQTVYFDQTDNMLISGSSDCRFDHLRYTRKRSIFILLS